MMGRINANGIWGTIFFFFFFAFPYVWVLFIVQFDHMNNHNPWAMHAKKTEVIFLSNAQKRKAFI